MTLRLDSLWADSLLEATTVMTEAIMEVAGVEEGLALQKDTYLGLARLAVTRLAVMAMAMAMDMDMAMGMVDPGVVPMAGMVAGNYAGVHRVLYGAKCCVE